MSAEPAARCVLCQPGPYGLDSHVCADCEAGLARGMERPPGFDARRLVPPEMRLGPLPRRLRPKR